MLRGAKRSEIEVVAPKEEEEGDYYGLFQEKLVLCGGKCDMCIRSSRPP